MVRGKVKEKDLILFLCIIIFSAFFISIYSEINFLDDTDLFKRLRHIKSFNLFNIFFPHSSKGLYYRPINRFLQYFDRFVLQLSPILMHVENILFHIANSCLVYCIAKLINERFLKSSELLFPFLVALFFGLNPLVVESVAWISGRTDILACLFVLLGVLFSFKFYFSKKWLYGLFSAFFFLCGSLSKETALMFVAALFFIFTSKEIIKNNKKIIFLYLIIVFSAFVGFFIFRDYAFTSNKSTIHKTLIFIFNDYTFALMKFFRMIGFYVKKMIFPFPLNFAINGVDPGYDILGFGIFLFSLYLFLKKKLLDSFFLSSLSFIFPSYFISFGQIAWTRYAERYAYISLAFFSVFFIYYLLKVIGNLKIKKIVLFLFLGYLFIFYGSDIYRSYQWISNIRLFEDTAKKSPKIKEVRILLGIAYLNKKKCKKAEEQFKAAIKIPSFSKKENFKAKYGLGMVYLCEGKRDYALNYLENLYYSSSVKPIYIFKILFDLYIKKAYKLKNEKYVSKVEYFANLFYNKRKDPMILYNIGKLFIIIGNRDKARNYLSKAYEKFHNKSPYKKFCKKILKKL